MTRCGPWLTLAAAFLATGCGSDKPQPIPVSGRITLDGGTWPHEGILMFSPVETLEGYPAIPGTAEFDTEGNFRVQTFTPGDGLMPGRYKVAVECWEQPPTYLDAQGKNSHVPPAYRDMDSSPLEIEVPTDGGRQELSLEVPKP